ncbi:MAG: hypothetical protein KDB79_11100 [Acidobacteria bacterium]|nr:hypothetical protein [Acidobacteriota bacterium]
MSKHNKEVIDSDKPYEADVISFSGILYFGAGLFLLIVITFGLMWILEYKVLLPDAEEKDAKAKQTNPLMMTEGENLPPEPRLQSAPGFGVDTKDGRVSLELREPQAELKELQKQWKDVWENGEKDQAGKTVIAIPIAEAKEKLIKSGGIKSVAGEQGEKVLRQASHFISGSSAGRMASEKRR